MDDDIDRYSAAAREEIGKLEFQVKKMLNKDFEKYISPDLFVNGIMVTVRDLASELSGNIVRHNLRLIDQQINKLSEAEAANPEDVQIGIMNEHFRVLKELYTTAHLSAYAMPVPSQFGKKSIWEKAQQGPNAIQCLRPPDKQGLPLIILHHAFLYFVNQLHQSLSKDDEPALKAGIELCEEMAKPFGNEIDRGHAFNKALDPIFPESEWFPRFRFGNRPGARGEIDAAFLDYRILREDKGETSLATADPYMQISRAFQAFTTWKESTGLKGPGAAKFLLVVLGPLFIIAGGFYDGISTIVEPLTPAMHMLPDHNRAGRPMIIAKCLAALRKAVELLPINPTGSVVPATPRIYSEILDDENKIIRPITFKEPLKYLGPLIFLGKIDMEEECLIKLVYGEYGTQVHRVLAREGLAPRLFGSQIKEGAPTAVVMEYLEPYGPGSGGWTSLYDLVKSGPQVEELDLALAVKKILDTLGQNNLVHGDFRPNNLMVHLDSEGVASLTDEGVLVKAIDFDWSGESGRVTYPLLRNSNLNWPGEVGDYIVVGHDEALVKDWWPSVFPGGAFPLTTV